jgi:hypothetical protein
MASAPKSDDNMLHIEEESHWDWAFWFFTEVGAHLKFILPSYYVSLQWNRTLFLRSRWRGPNMHKISRMNLKSITVSTKTTHRTSTQYHSANQILLQPTATDLKTEHCHNNWATIVDHRDRENKVLVIGVLGARGRLCAIIRGVDLKSGQIRANIRESGRRTGTKCWGSYRWIHDGHYYPHGYHHRPKRRQFRAIGGMDAVGITAALGWMSGRCNQEVGTT